MNVCVFCSSSSRLHPAYVETATALGRWIGSQGHTLVWGGCNVGTMDIVGRATHAAGGRTVAVLPAFLIERGLAFEDPDERVVTRDLAERKARFRDLADAYVALPGGVGTWEEILEVLALAKLGQLERPIVLANVLGYYEPLLALVRESIDQHFTPPDFERLYEVVADATGIVQALEARRPQRDGLDLGPVG